MEKRIWLTLLRAGIICARLHFSNPNFEILFSVMQTDGNGDFSNKGFCPTDDCITIKVLLLNMLHWQILELALLPISKANIKSYVRCTYSSALFGASPTEIHNINATSAFAISSIEYGIMQPLIVWPQKRLYGP